MTNDKDRAEFEAKFAILSPGCDFSRQGNGDYLNRHVHHTWEGWQAALAATPLQAKQSPTVADEAPQSELANRYERMFLAAVQSLAEISEALGIDAEEAATANGNELILEAIQERLKDENRHIGPETDGGRNLRYEGLFDGETEAERAARLASVAGLGEPTAKSEIALLEKAALRVGMKSLLNHGAASCVYSEGCNGVTQDHLIAFAREIALHCAVTLGGMDATR